MTGVDEGSHDATESDLRARDARLQLVSAVRLLLDRSIHSHPDVEALRRATELIEAANTQLGEPRRRQRQAWNTSAIDRDVPWDPGQVLTSHLIYGPQHPFSPEHVAVQMDGSKLSGTARYTQVYEGPPGMVHGGVVAAIFDGLQATVASVGSAARALTHSLTIRYLRGTPIEQDLHLDARIDRIDGRKVFTAATIALGADVTAESTGLFICT
jgi:acyl-coenzyme A thioesterase PaaI-like protein